MTIVYARPETILAFSTDSQFHFEKYPTLDYRLLFARRRFLFRKIRFIRIVYFLLQMFELIFLHNHVYAEDNKSVGQDEY